MSTTIFISSYFKDLPWLEHCLRSIQKFATGFEEVVVQVPLDLHMSEMNDLCKRHGASAVAGMEEPVGKGNLCQQIYKARADKECSGDFILYMDSDCVFTAPVTPATYFEESELQSLPYLCIRPWLKCREDEQKAWRETTDKCIGFRTDYSTMCRHPAVHPRWVLPKLRDYISRVHRMQFVEFMLSRKPDFPQGVSEFNLIGNFARQFYPENYAWVDLSTQPEPFNPLKQFWSHGSITPEIKSELKALGL